MESRDDRDMEPEESEGTFAQMETSDTATGAAALSFGTTQSQTPIGFSQSTPISQPQQTRTPFSQRIASSPFSAGSHAPWSSTPVAGTLPRGDMGRSVTNIAHLRPLHRLEPATPGTPMYNAKIVSVFGNSPGHPRTIRRNTTTHPGTTTAAAGGGGGGISLVDDADELMDLDNTFTLDQEEEHQLQQNLAETRIWGTDLNINSCRNVFKIFVEYYGIQDNTTILNSNTTTNNTNTNTNTIAATTGLSLYKRQLQYMHRTGDTLLNLNCSHVKAFPGTRQFYTQLQQYPQDIIPIMDNVFNTVYTEMFGEMDGGRRIQVRTYGMEEQNRMRGLDPKNIDQLLCIKGMVTRCSAIIPDLKVAFFRCYSCSHGLEVWIDKGRIEEPKSCPQCQSLSSMELIHNRGRYTDKQLIRLQETPDEIPAGETPHTVTLFAFDDLVDSVRPGDRIEVTGIFRAVPHRANPRMRSVKSIYKTYIDAIHFRRAEQGDDRLTNSDQAGEGSNVDRTVELSSSNPLSNPTTTSTNTHTNSTDINDTSATQFSTERLSEFYAFAAGGQVYDRLVRSFAPSIWEMDDVKRGLLCLLFGGTIRKGSKRTRDLLRKRALAHLHKNLNPTNNNSSRESKRQRRSEEEGMHQDSTSDHSDHSDHEEDEDHGDTADAGDLTREDTLGGVHQRGDINILLCGDPGTSKSQLLSYVHKLTPRGIYTSGKGSSAVGLTASVMRDPETRDMVLESGALVLSDNGICCIDEFDKMTDQTRAILHEAMEQQTVSITKAGIIATLNARTSILASANPVQSRYNAKLSVVENIKLPPTLLSRFDLIYLILDKPNEEQDRKLARHLVSLYYDEAEEEGSEEKKDSGLKLVDQKFLRDYILYARNNICPEISDAAAEVLVRNYVEMRSLGGRSMKTITATPRQLESLIRLAQALAKMRLSEEVTAEDVLEATRLMKVATQTAATDPRTGTIDMDMITTGQTALGREITHQLTSEVHHYLRQEYQAHSAQRGGRLDIKVNQIYQVLQHHKMNNSGNTNLGELELSVEKVSAAVEALVEKKMVVVLRSGNIGVLSTIEQEL